MKKLLLRLSVIVVLILIGLGIILAISLDRVVRNGIIMVGPEITKVDVKLADVKLSILSGSGELTGLVIGNPQEYKTPSAIDVGRAKLVLKPRSVLSDKVVIRSLQLNEPVITLEGGLKRNNLQTILKNMEEATGSTNQPATAQTTRPAQKLQVDEFILRGAKVNLSMPALNWQTATVVLPDIELHNLGQGPEGITAAELTRLALSAVLERVTAAASNYLSGQLGEAVPESSRKAVEKALDALKKK